MNLTQRTVRITFAALFSILIAEFIGLENSMSAGIIAILSILDTRLETVKTALARFLSTLLAFAVATIIFLIFGFSVYSFGIYLAIYIPLAYLGKVEAGIAPCSVLVTHFIIAQSVSWKWQINGLLIMVIGLVLALIFNMWIPSYDKKLEKHVRQIEKQMTLVLFLLEKYFIGGSQATTRIENELSELCDQVLEFDDLALIEYENTSFSSSIKDYYVKYAQMRKQQYDILDRMIEVLPSIVENTEENRILASIFGETAEQLDEKNPGIALLENIEKLYTIFRESELPKTREEFENRAILYYILTDFEKFLILKRDFYIEYGEHNMSHIEAN